MDAYALLTSQGWRGPGHTLHPTSDKSGLSQPLLVSKRPTNLGVGRKPHKTSDMWWMNAFDESLKGLDIEGGKVVQTMPNGRLDIVAKRGSRLAGNGGLYASFVKGESLSGTITPSEVEMVPSKKNRSEAEDRMEAKKKHKEHKARKAAKHAARARSLLGEESVVLAQIDREDGSITKKKIESKEQRRERRKQKKRLHQAEEIGIKYAMRTTKRRRKRED